MTRATVDSVRADPRAAVEFIKQARRQLESAGVDGVDRESAYGLCYQAAVKALTGALLAVGRRVTSGEAGHAVLIADARSQTRGDGAVFDRLDRMRRTRHRIFYDVAEVSRLELEDAMRDAQAPIDAAARFVLEKSS